MKFKTKTKIKRALMTIKFKTIIMPMETRTTFMITKYRTPMATNTKHQG